MEDFQSSSNVFNKYNVCAFKCYGNICVFIFRCLYKLYPNILTRQNKVLYQWVIGVTGGIYMNFTWI